MITTKQAARLRYLIRKFEIAVRADEMKGSQPPEEAQQIELELRHARLELAIFIVSHTDKETT